MLYLKPTLGLCNRLLLIDSALKFVKKYNFQKLKINWSKTQGFSDEKFQTLFDIQYIDKIIEFIDDEEYNSFSNKKEILKLEDLVEQDQFTLDYHYHRSQYEIFNYIIDNTFTYSWFAPFEYIFPNMIKHDKYYPFIQSISPSALLQTQLDNFHIDKNFVGIHIRRGDSYKSQYAYQYSGSTTQSYINLLNNELKETENIFLATDCEQTQEQIIKSCPNKNIIISNKNFVDINLTEWQPKPEQFTAALDLLLLSQCSKIYGNEFSTFGKTAAKINNINFYSVHISNSYHQSKIKLPPISLTVGVKNRFKQLKVSLASWLIQEDVKEILIIDWDSKDIDFKYLRELDDRINIITIHNQPNYEHAKVLNQCIKYAKYDHIIKMDVDYILNPYYQLNQWLDIEWDSQFMAGYWAQKNLDNSLGFIENINGFMSIHRKHIDAVGGYNDNFIGYGWEDCELYIRLQKQLNLTRITPPMCKDFLPIYHNPHQDYIRTKNQKIKNREESRLGNVSKTQYKHY